MRLTLVLISIFTLAQGIALEARPQTTPPRPQVASLSGRWRVRFTFAANGEKNLVFDSQARGSGSFMLLDAGPNNNAEPMPLPAVWSMTESDQVSFSAEVELPIGTCCRETGTLMFKGKFSSSNSMSGKAIFIGATEDQENFNGFRSMVGAFTAVRELK